ncbi:MAG: hypothetical protein COW34_03170 [Armatimonadetes bacterium CG17_big_fil_post_rev_8_21_14_2_50_66_6]|nr:MAG: hypothetical protein COW34_03170 [Armatimonadetes bacterium CG17_big_fil_post_rev_8_21_14_2_50_66_6]
MRINRNAGLIGAMARCCTMVSHGAADVQLGARRRRRLQSGSATPSWVHPSVPRNEVCSMSALKTVLIADDDELTQALVAEVVRPLGHEVLFASTGEEAIAKAGVHRPDLAILDVLMPRGHGFAVCGELRKRPELHGMKVLVLTSKAYAADRNQALALGADEFMTKPFDPDALRSAVERLLGEAGRDQQ